MFYFKYYLIFYALSSGLCLGGAFVAIILGSQGYVPLLLLEVVFLVHAIFIACNS